ncbi:hypothetical protein C5S42_12685 [Candidatus Methanomarinus sp.]|nr:hypothetical protein C5S42_12685 [ANME-2 cluster archaeon]
MESGSLEVFGTQNELEEYVKKVEHPLHKNHPLHIPVPHPQFSRTSGDNSTIHTVLL